MGSDAVIYIRDIRKARHMTMKELGKKVGVTESAIQLYETGKRKVDYEMLLKIAEALDCSALDLLNGFVMEKPVFNLPDELRALNKAWDRMSAEDHAIIRIIADKYR